MSRRKREKNRGRGVGIFFGVLVGLFALLCLGGYLTNQAVFKKHPTSIPTGTSAVATPNHTTAATTETAVPGTTSAPETTVETTASTELAVPEIEPGSSFEIWYLDVGQGDAACVICDGHAMLIDGGNKGKSDLMYSFLRSHSISTLDCVVASHPDADHIGGLAGALNYATTTTAYCTTTEHDTETFANFIKYLHVPITIPEPGDAFLLGSAKVTFLYPEAGRTASDNTSIALRIEYGTTSFLFAGDCEIDDESLIRSSGYELQSDVLKISHHGSAGATSSAFLKAVGP